MKLSMIIYGLDAFTRSLLDTSISRRVGVFRDIDMAKFGWLIALYPKGIIVCVYDSEWCV